MQKNNNKEIWQENAKCISNSGDGYIVPALWLRMKYLKNFLWVAFFAIFKNPTWWILLKF